MKPKKKLGTHNIRGKSRRFFSPSFNAGATNPHIWCRKKGEERPKAETAESFNNEEIFSVGVMAKTFTPSFLIGSRIRESRVGERIYERMNEHKNIKMQKSRRLLSSSMCSRRLNLPSSNLPCLPLLMLS